MSCPKCDGPSRDGLCRSCSLDDEREYFERRADEMAGENGGEADGD